MLDLQYATNDELIAELTRRNSFFGLVIWSNKEVKSGQEHHENFIVEVGGMNQQEVYQVIAHFLNAMQLS